LPGNIKNKEVENLWKVCELIFRFKKITIRKWVLDINLKKEKGRKSTVS